MVLPKRQLSKSKEWGDVAIGDSEPRKPEHRHEPQSSEVDAGVRPMQDKLQKYMLDNKYYETAIPLIRKFSKSYDEYYKKLLIASEKYIELNK